MWTWTSMTNPNVNPSVRNRRLRRLISNPSHIFTSPPPLLPFLSWYGTEMPEIVRFWRTSCPRIWHRALKRSVCDTQEFSEFYTVCSYTHLLMNAWKAWAQIKTRLLDPACAHTIIITSTCFSKNETIVWRKMAIPPGHSRAFLSEFPPFPSRKNVRRCPLF